MKSSPLSRRRLIGTAAALSTPALATACGVGQSSQPPIATIAPPNQ